VNRVREKAENQAKSSGRKPSVEKTKSFVWINERKTTTVNSPNEGLGKRTI